MIIYNLLNMQPQNQKNIVKVDKTWIEPSSTVLIQEFLICKACQQLIFDPTQCRKCQKLMCKKDMINSKVSNTCPLCKQRPYTATQQIHKTYQFLYKIAQFKCNICGSKKKMHIAQLITHIQKFHQMMIPGRSYYCHYQAVQHYEAQKCSIHVNMQIYHNLNKGQYKNIQIFDEQKVYQVDLDKMQISQNGKIKKLRKGDEKLHSIKQDSCIMWCYQDPKNKQQFFDDILQKFIEGSYQEFLANKYHNEIIYDYKDRRYRLSFNFLIRTNTQTQVQCKIKRLTFNL